MKWTWVELETRLTFVLIGEPIELGISQSTSSGLLSGCLEKVLLFSGNLPHSNLSTVQCQSGDLYWCCIHPTSLLPLECLSQGEGGNIYWAHSMDLKKSESSTAAWKSSGVCPWGNWCNNSTLFHIDISKVSGWFSVDYEYDLWCLFLMCCCSFLLRLPHHSFPRLCVEHREVVLHHPFVPDQTSHVLSFTTTHLSPFFLTINYHNHWLDRI